MTLSIGTPAPRFAARTHDLPALRVEGLGGFYLLLAFMPDDPVKADEALALLQANRGLFDDRRRSAFGVVRDLARFEALRPQTPGLRYFLDDGGRVADQYKVPRGEGLSEGRWILLDPSLRVLLSLPIDEHDAAFAAVRSFDDPDTHAQVPLTAPVLIVPRVFEPEFCRRLIAEYERLGGGLSGVMRVIDGKTVGMLSASKSRRDAVIEDEPLRAEIRERIISRLLPEISRAFAFNVSRKERYIVARYDAEEGGFFKPHRDNTTTATKHRQFACSINLNAEEFEGGDLRFPEFGSRTYRPPTGGAVVFSCSLLHEATPVTRGTRFAYLPFFYNEVGAKIRQATEQNLVKAEPAPAG